MERTIRFAGQSWLSRSGGGGPGNGHWSNDGRSVWVDALGHLHLHLRFDDGVWWQTGVRAAEPAGFGTYVFRVISSLDRLPSCVILGLFLYQDDAHELDIEVYGTDGTAARVMHTVQPAREESSVSVDARLNGDRTRHAISWSAERAAFRSSHGHAVDGPDILRFTFAPSPAARLTTHMNLWVMGDGVPSSETEVIIAGYEVTE